MFQQRKSHPMPPMAASQNEHQAKEKLAGYVYEYLVHAGASKTAEMFKSEMLSQQNIAPIDPHNAPGFLQDWFCVFWDLYCASPERREKFDPSQEAKAFHEFGFIPPSTYPAPMINGMHGQPQFGNGAPGGMGMPPNGEGMVPNYFGQRPGPGNQPGPSVQSNQASPIAGPQRYGPQGARSGAPTPSSVMGGNGREFANFPPGPPPPHMFNEQQMRNMQAAGQRMPLNARIPTNFPQMRHMRPGVYGGQFIDSPSGTPPFPQNPMMQNGAMCPPVSLMSSPGPGGPPPPGSVPTNPDGTQQQPHDPRFMMPGASSVPPQFGMSHHDGSGTPTSSGVGGPTSVPGLNGAMGMQQPPTSEGGGQLQSLLNGTDSMDMKQSPASVHGTGAVNGGTPGGHTNPGSIQQNQGGPASVHGCHQGPGSVHSQSGAPNSQQQPHQTPTSESAPSNPMDQFQMVNQSGGDANEAASEISKIKASLFTDLPTSNY